MKKLVSLVLAVLMVFLAVSCENKTPEPDKQPTEDGTITVEDLAEGVADPMLNAPSVNTMEKTDSIPNNFVKNTHFYDSNYDAVYQKLYSLMMTSENAIIEESNEDGSLLIKGVFEFGNLRTYTVLNGYKSQGYTFWGVEKNHETGQFIDDSITLIVRVEEDKSEYGLVQGDVFKYKYVYADFPDQELSIEYYLNDKLITESI